MLMQNYFCNNLMMINFSETYHGLSEILNLSITAFKKNRLSYIPSWNYVDSFCLMRCDRALLHELGQNGDIIHNYSSPPSLGGPFSVFFFFSFFLHLCVSVWVCEYICVHLCTGNPSTVFSSSTNEHIIIITWKILSLDSYKNIKLFSSGFSHF